MRFRDRRDAGRHLVGVVGGLGLAEPIVLALPRGGVPVAFEVAMALDAPLDVLVARKIGAPGHPELGIGALAEGGATMVDRPAHRSQGVSDEVLHELLSVEAAELDRRVALYRGDRPLPDVGGREVVLVDDGLATGVTAEAAVQSLRARHPARLVLAVPVGAPGSAARLRAGGHEVLCVDEPSPFLAVGHFYDRFDQTTDEEVLTLLALARSASARGT